MLPLAIFVLHQTGAQPALMGLKPLATFNVDAFGSSAAFGGSVSSLFFSPDEKLIYVGTADGQLQTWNFSEKRLIHTSYFYAQVDKYRRSPDGRKVLVRYREGTSAVFDLSTGNRLWVVDRWPVVAFVPDGTAVYSLGRLRNQTLRISPTKRELVLSGSAIGSENGRTLAVGDKAGVTLYRADSHGRLTKKEFIQTPRLAAPMALSGDGRVIAMGMGKHATWCKLWDVSAKRWLTGAFPEVFSLSNDGHAAFVRTYTSHGIGLMRVGYPGAFGFDTRGGFCFSDSGRLVAMSYNKEVQIYRMERK